MARGLVGLGTAAWVVLASAAGCALIYAGACARVSDDPRPRSGGAELVCGGAGQFDPLSMAFLLTSFTAVAVLIRAWEPTWRHTRRLCLGAALAPLGVYGVLRVVVALG